MSNKKVCDPNNHNLDVSHLGVCTTCGGTNIVFATRDDFYKSDGDLENTKPPNYTINDVEGDMYANFDLAFQKLKEECIHQKVKEIANAVDYEPQWHYHLRAGMTALEEYPKYRIIAKKAKNRFLRIAESLEGVLWQIDSVSVKHRVTETITLCKEYAERTKIETASNQIKNG